MPIRMSGLTSGLDTEAIIEELMSAQKTKLTKIENKQTKLTWTQEKWKELNTKLYSLYTDKLSPLRLQSAYQTKKVNTSNESKVKASGNANAVNGTHTLQIKQLASTQYVTGGKLTVDNQGKEVGYSTLLRELGYSVGDTITITNGKDEAGNPETYTFSVDSDTTIEDFVKFARESGLNASFDTSQKRLFISAKESGKDNAFSIAMTSQNGLADLSALGLGDAAKTVDASDAIFRYNGVEYEDTTNNVTINGLTFELTGTTSGYDSANEADRESISVTVSTDVDAVYNKVKEFLTSYNEILKEMNELYYASSSRGYDPLTDEQKEAMSDEEVEKWEKKIKDSLLRSDSTLGELISGMKNALAGNVEVNGQKYSLAGFGIMTSTDYTEKGLLHIYGDKEDAVYADKDDKLKAALANDPEGTSKALAEIFGNLYSEMTKKMATSSLSSALTFYNDKQLSKLETQYKKEYTTMEERLKTIEDRYYDQFTAMEKAMANMNSQQSALSGLLGTGS